MDNTVAAVARQAGEKGLTAINLFKVKDGEIRYGQLDGHALKEGRLDARVAANTPEGVSHDGLVRADLPVARQRDTQWEYATTALTPPPWQRA